MIFMMAAMAFPMIGAAASAAGTTATLGDLGLATVDMYWEMIKAPFTDGGVVVDAVSNAADGNLAANSYEWGMMDHGEMGHHHGGEHAHDMSAIDHTGHEHHAMGNSITQDFNSWQNNLSTAELETAQNNAKSYGMSLEQYYQNLPPSHH